MTKNDVPKNLFQHSSGIGEGFVLGEGEKQGEMREEMWERQNPRGCQVPSGQMGWQAERTPG